MLNTGTFNGVDSATGLWNVYSHQKGCAILIPPYVYGGTNVGLYIVPNIGDKLLLDTVQQMYTLVIGLLPPHDILNGNTPTLLNHAMARQLQPGEVLLYAGGGTGTAGQPGFKSGTQIFIGTNGDLWLTPALGARVMVGNPSPGSPVVKPVVRDGDSVSTPSGNGTVHSTTSTLYSQ